MKSKAAAVQVHQRLVGQVFGTVTVTEKIDKQKVAVKCECGNSRTYATTYLYTHRDTATCGDRIKHPSSHVPLGAAAIASYAYGWWRSRPLDGRCAGWDSSATFLHDIGERPSEAHRLAKSGDNVVACGYCEECIKAGESCNVTWSTDVESARERRIAGPDGVEKSIAAHARDLGISRSAAWLRVQRGGGVDAFTNARGVGRPGGRPAGTGGCSVCRAGGAVVQGHNAATHNAWLAKQTKTNEPA
jgi:hypothetical protein